MRLAIEHALVVVPAGDVDTIVAAGIYIEGSHIVSVGEAPADFIADTCIDARDHLAIPGLINAHTHTYMSMMRNSADDLSFTDWLFGTVQLIEDRLTPEDAYWGSLLGQVEMIRSGTTCFNDQQMHIHQTTRAVRESGLRATVGRGLVGDHYDRSDHRLAEAFEEMDEIRDCDRLTYRLNPHAPYSCGPDYLHLIADVARERGCGIHIHIAESPSETDTIWRDYHCTPVEYVCKSGVFDSPCVAAHCIRVNASDRQILARKGVSVVTNPASNMKLGNGFAPVPELIDAGVNVCLGSDGAASNNAQNMFREMSLLALIHKGTHATSQCLSADDVFRMATIKGAQALNLNTGSLEVGKKADLALLDLDTPSMMPHNNLLAALVYSANGSEVDTLIVDGRIVMNKRELITLDEERIYHEIRRICTRLGLAPQA